MGPAAAYFDSIEERLLSDERIADVDFVKRWQTDVNGYFRAHVVFKPGDQLEFSEYVQRTPEDQISVVTYTFQWMTADNHLICRWDNTPHFPSLPGFPHHRHDGAEDSVLPDEPRSIFPILAEIERRSA